MLLHGVKVRKPAFVIAWLVVTAIQIATMAIVSFALLVLLCDGDKVCRTELLSCRRQLLNLFRLPTFQFAELLEMQTEIAGSHPNYDGASTREVVRIFGWVLSGTFAVFAGRHMQLNLCQGVLDSNHIFAGVFFYFWVVVYSFLKTVQEEQGLGQGGAVYHHAEMGVAVPVDYKGQPMEYGDAAIYKGQQY